MPIMPKKTLELLVKDNDYIIQVKNSRYLLTRLVQEGTTLNLLVDKATTEEWNRGRFEHRTAFVYKAQVAIRQKWTSIKTIIAVRRIRDTRKGKSDVTHYYISSLSHEKASFFLVKIRKHWWIENKLHYVKDTVLKEDSTKLGSDDRYKKNAIYRNIIFNQLVKNKGNKSLKAMLEYCTNKVKMCWKLIRT